MNSYLTNFYQKPLKIPHFIKHSELDKENGLQANCFINQDISCEEWYSLFEKKIVESYEQKLYLPVFRLSDGEFTFILGRKFDFKSLSGIRNFLASLKKTIQYQSLFISSGRPGYCEHYKFWEYKKAKKIFETSFKFIAQKGILCFNFSDSSAMNRFFEPYAKYLKENLNYDFGTSYSFMYFVYALLFGPTGKKLMTGSNILVITSNMVKRNENLKKGLLNLRAKEVEFCYTSLNQPLLDKIDHSKITITPDLIIIGAGVGAANILVQLERYNCPCIDAGFFVDVVGNDSFTGKRAMTVSDEDWDKVYGNTIPAWHSAYKA